MCVIQSVTQVHLPNSQVFRGGKRRTLIDFDSEVSTMFLTFDSREKTS